MKFRDKLEKLVQDGGGILVWNHDYKKVRRKESTYFIFKGPYAGNWTFTTHLGRRGASVRYRRLSSHDFVPSLSPVALYGAKIAQQPIPQSVIKAAGFNTWKAWVGKHRPVALHLQHHYWEATRQVPLVGAGEELNLYGHMAFGQQWEEFRRNHPNIQFPRALQDYVFASLDLRVRFCGYLMETGSLKKALRKTSPRAISAGARNAILRDGVRLETNWAPYDRKRLKVDDPEVITERVWGVIGEIWEEPEAQIKAANKLAKIPGACGSLPDLWDTFRSVGDLPRINIGDADFQTSPALLEAETAAMVEIQEFCRRNPVHPGMNLKRVRQNHNTLDTLHEQWFATRRDILAEYGAHARVGDAAWAVKQARADAARSLQLIHERECWRDTHVLPEGVSILITPEEYASEGAAMKHCISSYFRRETMCFHVKYDNEEASLELHPKTYRIHQLMGVHNTRTSPELAAMVRAWVDSLRDALE